MSLQFGLDVETLLSVVGAASLSLLAVSSQQSGQIDGRDETTLELDPKAIRSELDAGAEAFEGNDKPAGFTMIQHTRMRLAIVGC